MSVPSVKKRNIDATRRSQGGEINALFRGSSLRKTSSLDLGWHGVAIERRTAESGESPEEEVDHHFIAMWDRQAALGERADLRGKFAPYAKCPGTISLGPANILPAVRARTRSDVIACTLDPALTDYLEQELDSRPTASLHERPGIEDEGLHQLLLLLLAESEGGGSYGRLYADALIQALATRFLFLARSERPPEPPHVSALPRRILQRVLDRIHADFQLDLDLETLATVSGYSRAHFLRMFRLATGTTPHQYLQGLRLEHARRQLEDTPASHRDCPRQRLLEPLAFHDPVSPKVRHDAEPIPAHPVALTHKDAPFLKARAHRASYLPTSLIAARTIQQGFAG